jgi:DNA-binding MarR family transcriptional regulator
MTTTSTPTAARAKGGARLTAEELAAWRGMLLAHSRLTQELDSDLMSAHGLSLTSYEVLLFLVDKPDGALRMSDLADGVLLSRSGLTRLVDRLERAGLVRREPCPGDARGLNCVITDAGREAFAAARKTHLAGVRRLYLEHFSDDELATLAELFERLASATDDTPACG